MATRQVLKEEFLTCIICHEVFRDPVTLHCGHTLCAQCVTEYTKTQKDALKQGCLSCPHCRGLTTVPIAKKPVEEWTGQLKTGFFVKGLVEKFALEGNDDDDSCSLCKEDGETRPATVWCSDCGHALCVKCQRVHRKLNKDHEVSSISGEYQKTVRKKTARTLCQKHPDFVIDLFCEDCDLAICQRCSTLQHRKCESVILLEDALSKIVPVLEDLKDEVEMKVTEEQSKVSDLISHVENLHSSAGIAETEISDAMEKLMEKIHEKEKELKDELAERKEKTLQRLEADIKYQKMRLEEYRQRQSFLQHAVASTDANTVYEAYTVFSKRSMKGGEVESQLADYEIYEFEDNTDAFLTLLDQDNYGKVNGRKKLRRIKPKLVEKLDTAAMNISGLTVMYPEDIRTVVVAYTLSQCVKSFPVNGEMDTFQEYTLQVRDEVYDVTKISDTRAAICLYSKKQIVFIKVEPKLGTESRVVTKRSYIGLACLSSATLGALSYLPGLVDIIDMSGRILKTFGTDTLSVICPGYISAVNNKRILVSDGKKHQTVMFDGQGQLQFVYHHNANPPSSVCQGRVGEIFVVDTERVCELSENGEFVSDVIVNIAGLTDRSPLFVDDKFMYVSVQKEYICIYQYLS